MSFVYFAQCRDAVKIGYTQGDPAVRIAALQTGCPWPITLLGAIASPPAGEVLLHNAMAAHRMRGEWFSAEGVSDALRGLGVDAPELIYQVAWFSTPHPEIVALTKGASRSHTPDADGLITLTAYVRARDEYAAVRGAVAHFAGPFSPPRRTGADPSAGYLFFCELWPGPWDDGLLVRLEDE